MYNNTQQSYTLQRPVTDGKSLLCAILGTVCKMRACWCFISS